MGKLQNVVLCNSFLLKYSYSSFVISPLTDCIFSSMYILYYILNCNYLFSIFLILVKTTFGSLYTVADIVGAIPYSLYTLVLCAIFLSSLKFPTTTMRERERERERVICALCYQCLFVHQLKPLFLSAPPPKVFKVGQIP